MKLRISLDNGDGELDHCIVDVGEEPGIGWRAVAEELDSDWILCDGDTIRITEYPVRK